MRTRFWSLLVPLAVLAVSLTVGAVLFANERNDAAARRMTDAQQAGARVAERVNTTASRLSSTTGLFAASEHVRPDEFRAFAQSLLRDPSIDNVAYIEVVPEARRAAFERRVGLPLVDGPGQHPPRSAHRAEHYAAAILSKRQSQPRRFVNDVSVDPARRTALRRARDLGKPQTTAPVRTLDDNTPALLVYVPIYRGRIRPATLAERRRTLRGWAAGVIPLRALVDAGASKSVELSYGGRPVVGTRLLHDGTSLPLALLGNRRFGVRVATGTEGDYALPVAVAVGGAVLAAMVALVVLVLLRREGYAQALVTQRLTQQRKAEAALAESEARLRLLAETSSDWITLVDSGGKYTYSSPSVERLLGRTPDDIVGRDFTDLMHPDDVALATEAFLEVFSGRDHPVDLRVRHRDGHWVPFEVAIAVIRDSETREVQEIRAASRDVSERQELERELRRLAIEDAVTGLPNRRALNDRLAAELTQAVRYGGGAVIMLDLDRFKLVNDTFGHAVGDKVLARVARVLEGRIRGSDMAARLGGDEFAVLLPRADEDDARIAAEAILTALRQDAELAALFGRPVRASAGVAAMSGERDETPEALLHRADNALYDAKRSGRDRVGEAPHPRSAART